MTRRLLLQNKAAITLEQLRDPYTRSFPFGNSEDYPANITGSHLVPILGYAPGDTPFALNMGFLAFRTVTKCNYRVCDWVASPQERSQVTNIYYVLCIPIYVLATQSTEYR